LPHEASTTWLGGDLTVGVNPVEPPPTVSGGQVGDLFAVSV